MTALAAWNERVVVGSTSEDITPQRVIPHVITRPDQLFLNGMISTTRRVGQRKRRFGRADQHHHQSEREVRSLIKMISDSEREGCRRRIGVRERETERDCVRKHEMAQRD
jgi:hypothetical protein